MPGGDAGNERGSGDVDASEAYRKQHRDGERGGHERVYGKERERDRHDGKAEEEHPLFQKHAADVTDEESLIGYARQSYDAERVSNGLFAQPETVRKQEAEGGLHARKPERHDGGYEIYG